MVTTTSGGEDGRSPEDIFAEWAWQAEAGNMQPLEPLFDAHPEHLAALQRLHEDWKLFAPILGKVIPGLMASEIGIRAAPVSHAEDDDDLPSAELLDRLRIHTPNAGRYRFRAVIGHGGGGVVLKVWDSKLNRPLAMKVVLGRGEDRPTGDTPRVGSRALARFVDEARIASQLNHPGIVPVHELGADETGRAFFTMKLVRGEHLGVIYDHVRSGHDGWNLTRALGALLRVCEAMSYAHDKGVIHRDLKPANVMVGRYGEVYVMDWGLARVAGEEDVAEPLLSPRPADIASQVDSIRAKDRAATPDSLLRTMDGAVMGTPMYMAPEQARSEARVIDPRSDVYAVGAMLYELIAEQAPYLTPGAMLSSWAVYQMLLEGPPKSLALLAPRAPAELVAICEKAMSREIPVRYPSMQALATDLRSFLEGRVVAAYETGAWAEAKKWVGRNRAFAGALGAAALLLVVGTVQLAAKNTDLRVANQTIAHEKETAEEQRRQAESFKVEAQQERDVARWRSWIAAAKEAFPEDPAMRAMLVREAPASLTDPYSVSQSIMTVLGDYYRVCTLRGHEKAVRAAAWSPDGTRIVTASTDGTARVWNANGTGESMILRGHDNAAISAAWSPDGKHIVTSSDDNTARIWNADGTGSPVTLSHNNTPTAAWSPDGKWLVTSSVNDPVRLWNADGGGVPLVLGIENNVKSDAWSPDGTHIMSLARDGTVQIWNADGSGTPVLLGQHDAVTSAAWSPDSTRLLTSSGDGRVHVWNLDDRGEPVERALPSGADSSTWSPDGRRIATLSADTAWVWNADGTGDPLALRGHADDVNSAAWSPNGTLLATASDDNTIRIWNADGTGDCVILRGHVHDVTSAAWSPDGQRVLSASKDATARVWNVEGFAIPLVLAGHDNAVTSGAWSPDGKRIATASDDHTARIWPADAPGSPLVLGGHADRLNAIAWSPDGGRLLTASDDQTARIWDANGVGEAIILARHTGPVTSAAWSPDGTCVATASVDHTACVWRVNSPRTPVILRGHTDRLNSVVWSPDGMRVLTTSDDYTARLWTKDGVDPLAELHGHTGIVNSAEWCRDGTRLVTVSEDHTARVWNASLSDVHPMILEAPRSGGVRVTRTATGFTFSGEVGSTGRVGSDGVSWDITITDGGEGYINEQDALPSPVPVLEQGRRSFAVNCAAWSPDAQRLLTTTYDARTVNVWHADGIGAAWPCTTHQGRVTAVAWSPRGDYIASVSDDGNARVVGCLGGNADPIVLRGHRGSLNSVAWSPDGRRLVTTSADNTARVWTVDWPLLREQLWQSIDDLLSPDERVRYLGEAEAEAKTTYERQKAERDARLGAR